MFISEAQNFSRYLEELWECGVSELIVPNGKTSYEYLRMLSLKGLHRKYKVTKEIKERWEDELNIISSCKLVWLYLLLWDFINYANEKDIIMSPGCGTITGSLVAYSLGITDVDPIKYNLLMERFLNQEQEYPSGGVRIELEKGGCQILFDYVISKYGNMMLIFLEKLEISFVDVEELSIISETLKEIADKRKEDIDINEIDYGDSSVFDFINAHEINDSIFLNGMYNQIFTDEIKIESMEDFIARISLARPGLEERCSKYITNKNNPKMIPYKCFELEKILAPSYGCILYQEQIMQILNSLGGFSPEQSNSARRGMSKSKDSECERHAFVYGNNGKGIHGCVAKGIRPKIAEKIFDEMWISSIYAFNKSHATALAINLYRMAWLKKYYREEYLAALEYVESGEEEK